MPLLCLSSGSALEPTPGHRADVQAHQFASFTWLLFYQPWLGLFNK